MMRNSASNEGGGILNDGGSGSATLRVINSTISGNSAGAAGGGIFSDGQSGFANVVIVAATLSGNTSPLGGAIENFARENSNGTIFGTATVTVVNSTLSGHSAGSVHN